MIITKEECRDWHYSSTSGEIASTTHAAFPPHPLQNIFSEMEIVVNEDIQLNFLCCQQNALAYIHIRPHKNYTKLNKKKGRKLAAKGRVFLSAHNVFPVN